MKLFCNRQIFLPLLLSVNLAMAAPVIDPLPDVRLPAGKSLTLPVTASSSNGQPLSYTVTSSTSDIAIETHATNPFWKLTVAQLAPANSPGAFQTPFRGGLMTVTNLGDLTFMLLRDRAPRTVAAIASLTCAGFYNRNTIFHRVIPGFMIQGGDPATNGTGGPVFRYDDEFNVRALFSGSGQLALANSGKDTAGSQFFVTLGAQRFLDLGYTLFGQLLRGFQVVTNVINTPRNTNDLPLAEVIITRASLVPNLTDTVITLTGTNAIGASATIQVIADDGAGGRTTNTFMATTVSDAGNNSPAILNAEPITNKFCPVNGRLTNYISAFDLETNVIFYGAGYLDAPSQANSTNSTFNSSTGELVVVPNAGYRGPLRLFVRAASNPTYQPTDQQFITFAVDDVPISVWGTDFLAPPLMSFTNQLLATFTNGRPNSPAGNFTAAINWGDNSIAAGSIGTNTSGGKEVRGSHTFTNSGIYPVYITIKSYLGAEATVVSTITVPPSLSFMRVETNNSLRWPAWAFEYRLQASTNLATTDWAALTNLATLVGYENLVANTTIASNLFFRLKR